MTREWKPGDVAMVNDCTRPDEPWKPATCTAARTPGRETTWVLHDIGSEVWSSVSDARPIVVIDPEDGDQVDDLCKALVEAMYAAGDRASAANGVHPSTVSAALRSLIEPPKPEEPTDLRARVFDATGLEWAKSGRGCWFPLRRGVDCCGWDELLERGPLEVQP